jgi:hypothetical protein
MFQVTSYRALVRNSKLISNTPEPATWMLEEGKRCISKEGRQLMP